MYNPLVSIIIPVYNGKDYIEEAIKSALNQTYNNIEILVINDGSNDNGITENLILDFGDKIKYFHKENGGVSTALNYGIEVMKGDFFSWLSHDDLYEPEKIEVQINSIIESKLDPNTTILATDINYINAKGNIIYKKSKFKSGFFTDKEMFKLLCKRDVFYGCALLIPKNALIKVEGFKKEYKFIQDWICWLEIAMNKNSFLLIDKKLVKARVHENQQTKKISKVWPKEITKYLLYILNKINIKESNEKDTIYYLRTILFNKCSRIKGGKLQKEYIDLLNEKKAFNKIDVFKYFIMKLKGRSINLLKILYRSLFQLIYRR